MSRIFELLGKPKAFSLNLKNVTINTMKEFGNKKSILIFLVVFFIGCSKTNKIFEVHNKMMNMVYSEDYYFNYELYGDYEITDSVRFIRSQSGYNSILRRYKPQIHQAGKTFVEPYFNFSVIQYVNGLTINTLKEVFQNKNINYSIENNVITTHRKDDKYFYTDIFKPNIKGVSQLVLYAPKQKDTIAAIEFERIFRDNSKRINLEDNEIINFISLIQDGYFANYMNALTYVDTSNFRFKKAIKSLVYQDKSKIDTLSQNDYNQLDSIFMNANVFPAKDYVLNATKNASFVMVNENHFIPENRVFAESLLSGLREQGYKYLFAEGIESNVDNLNQLNTSLGFYPINPEYRNFLKRALELGMKIYAYESNYDCDKDDRTYCSNFRDSIQAKNILRRTNEFEPNRKVIIYCGFEHLNKKSDSGWKKLGERLIEKLPNDNFIMVDQSILVGTNTSGGNRNYYQYINEKFKISEPSVVSIKSKLFLTKPGVFDIQVCAPLNYLIDNMKEVQINFPKYLKNNFLIIYDTPKIFWQQIPYKIVKIDSLNKNILINENIEKMSFVILNSDNKPLLIKNNINSEKKIILNNE